MHFPNDNDRRINKRHPKMNEINSYRNLNNITIVGLLLKYFSRIRSWNGGTIQHQKRNTKNK
jgi:hypothetical protein